MMFGFFYKFKYETIATRHHTVNWQSGGKVTSTEQVTYIFKENGFGKRKVDIHAYGDVKRYGYDKNNDSYHNIVLPWLEHDPALNTKQEEPEPEAKKEGNVISITDKLEHRKDKDDK